ncbi:TonB-dependent receptor plug domain-containing protein [Poseidonibacter ostreae]|jgi:iron complex outermembrane recepter protein|uniref:TonB-dependent receptor n=1 Tax=Poseidonibacter ostreae TaxID=2654171 RepID=A0A6L4WUG7_9BACT|nr:TonB-dependent receptor [Poseidonibacter ostreae]KAB7885670.1 TonB-dependent receptor [Poseidonibacter ostreae]KAB7888374.1 TonB-dependent receptor [Poseidonibacter ostreae]KAB7889846.1 TonB-dependent receptor [Poseidonibacter ostreae]
MKRIISLSLVCASVVLSANETTVLEQISVVEKANTKIVKDVSNEQIKSADLAEALTKNIPSISIVRRSGIANDIILRGQKKDNINILIDNAKIYGACPNRMDPATSHVLSNNIESVKVIEGPYDVENFGTLSGNVIVKTKEPSKEVSGEINLGAGSFGYKKAAATISGGTDKFKLLVSTSIEKGDQYEDGNGNDFLEQQKASGVDPLNQYSQSDLEAFEKKTLLTKAVYNIDDSSEINLSYTANRSDNVLYPNTPMDADYDDSNIYTIGYTKRDLADFSKELNLDYYYSNVDHPMSTTLRNNGAMQMTNHMKSSIWGVKLKNSTEIKDYLLTLGLDTSVRNWRGKYYSLANPYINDSIASTDTTNKAIFSKIEKSFGKLDLEFGARYDYTDIETIDSTKKDNKYTALSANIFAIYNADENTKYFAGIGKSSRVPDARELYSKKSSGAYTGNDDLEDTKNYEADLGFEKIIGAFNIRTKLFYSVLKDYIYNSGTFENIDAKIYGLDIGGFYYMNDNVSFDYGLAYQRGKKDGNYSDKDLAEIPPLKANIALNYEDKKAKYTAEVLAVDNWNSYDSSADERELAGYAVVNLKYNNEIFKNIGLTLGVDNVLDKTYNSTNTYQDITYVGTGDVQLLNDPGRYFYANLKYSF